MRGMEEDGCWPARRISNQSRVGGTRAGEWVAGWDGGRTCVNGGRLSMSVWGKAMAAGDPF